MAKFEITAPDGATYEIEAPEGTTEDQAIAYVQRTMGSGGVSRDSAQEKFTSQFMSQWEGGSEEGEAEAKKAWEREQTNVAPDGRQTLREGEKPGGLAYWATRVPTPGLGLLGGPLQEKAAEVIGNKNLSSFVSTMNKDSLKKVIQNGIAGMVSQGIGRKFEDWQKQKLPEDMRPVPVPEGYRLPTKDEFERGIVERRDEYIPIDPKKGLYDTISAIGAHFATDPGLTAAELVKGIYADPELLIPIVGQAAAPAKAANILARLRAVAAVGVEGAAWGAAAAGAEQFAKGEYDTNKVIAGAAIGGGAALGLMGVLQIAKFKKAIPDAELEAGSISAETTRKLMKELQGEGKVEVVPTREAAEAAGMEVVGVRPDGFIAEHTPTSIKLAVDADLRVTQQASDLMSGIRRNYKTGEVLERGVTFSEAEVFRAREANPALAKKMDEIAEMRQVEQAYWEAKQWAEEQVPPQERLARRREVEGLQKTQEQFDLEGAQRSFDQETQGTVPNELIYDPALGRFLEPAKKTRLSEGVVLEVDPQTGSLRAVTPEAPAVEVIGRDIPKSTFESAAAKKEQGRDWDMTPEERIAWDRAGQEIAVETFGGKVPEVREFTPASTLGVLEARAPMTARTFERLPKNRTEFTKKSIEDLTRMQDVPKLERDVLQGILRDHAGESIKATTLMKEFEQRTGQFQLKPEVLKGSVPEVFRGKMDQSRQGLSRIGRTPEKLANDALEVVKWQMPERLAGMKDVPHAMKHFPDDKMFGWTRRFEEGGVRHVVELQSDLMAAIKQSGMERALERYGALEKNWTKRLIQEELSDAGRAGQGSVRFATADTAAKVQGWVKGESGKFLDVHQGLYDRYAGDVTRYLKSLDGKQVTDALGHTWWEVPSRKGVPARMAGNADPRLLIGLAAGAGLGIYALSNPDAMKDLAKGDGTGLAMMVGLLGVTGGKGAGRVSRILASDAAKTVARSAGEIGKVMDGVLGETSTRIQNISPRTYGRLSEFFRNTQAKTHTIGLDVHPFTKAVMKVEGEGGARLLEAFKQADAREVGRLLDKHAPELKEEWQTYQRAMRDVGEELVKAGVLSELRPDWTVPRVVKGYAGLVDAMGLEMKDAFTRAMKDAEMAAQKAGRSGLNELERAIVADQFLQGRAPRGQGKPGFARERVFGEGKIPQELLPFYHDLGEATNIYLNQAIRAIELRKLFGKDAQFKTDVRGRKVLDLDSSIDSLGKVAQEDLAAGRMTTAQMDELKGLVSGALDNRSMHWALQDFRNMSYMMTTGNLGTAITQLGDLPVSVVMNGLKPTLRAFTERVRGRSKLTWEDMGGVDRIAEEFVGRDRPTQRALNKIHEWAQVTRMDTVAKDTYINAAFDRLEGQVKSPAGEVRFMQKYEPIFGKKEAELALQDFQKGIVSDSTKMVVFSELADVQPITRMEMPSWAAKNPNARVLMMLKSYTLKQIDLVRRQGVAKITEGFARNDKALAQEGMKFLGKYAIMMGLGGAGVQQLKSLIFSGTLEDMDAGDIALNAFKTMGYNEFMREKWRQGKKVESVMDTALPPYQAWNTLMKADRDSVKSLPVVGKLFHSWVLGGAEIARAQRARRKALEKRRERPGYEDRMERLREARRARLIAEGRSAR